MMLKPKDNKPLPTIPISVSGLAACGGVDSWAGLSILDRHWTEEELLPHLTEEFGEEVELQEVDPFTESIQLGTDDAEGTNTLIPTGKISLEVEIGRTGHKNIITFYVLADKMGPPVTLGKDWQLAVDAWVHQDKGIWLEQLQCLLPLLTQKQCEEWVHSEVHLGMRAQVEKERINYFGAFMKEAEYQKEASVAEHPDREALIKEAREALRGNLAGKANILDIPATSEAQTKEFSVAPSAIKNVHMSEEADMTQLSWGQLFRLTLTVLGSAVGELVQNSWRRILRRKKSAATKNGAQC